MHPFWNKIVELCPRWVAPNLLTFVGFLFTLGNFLMFSWLDYWFYASDDEHPEHEPIPRWAFALAAANIFIAYTLDGIDGKQARRTGTSGPLGELFDHGLDSWSAALIPTAMYSIFGRGSQSITPLRMYYVLWNVFVNFYLSHFEKYNTGVLFLPWGYDFSMLGSVLVFLLTAVGGHEAWKFTLPGGYTAGLLFELLLYVSALVSNLPVVAWNIYKSYANRTGKMRPFSEAVRPLVPIAMFLALGSLWVCQSPGGLERDPRAMYFMTGTIFSNICCRLIVAQMSGTRCETWNALLAPLVAALALVLSTGDPALELALLYLLVVVTTAAHLHYGAGVVRAMCRHFHISCFSIRPPHDERDHHD